MNERTMMKMMIIMMMMMMMTQNPIHIYKFLSFCFYLISMYIIRKSSS